MEKKQSDLCHEILRRLNKANVLKDFILIGSWCLYFYKDYFQDTPYIDQATIKTRDIDFLISDPAKITSKIDIPDMLKDLGFVITFKGKQGFTLFFIFTLLYLYVNVGIYSYKRRLEGAVAHRGSLQTIIDYYNKLSQFDEAVKIIKKSEAQGEAVFKELSNIVPVNIILDELILGFNDRKVEFHGVIYPESPVAGDELTRFMEMIEDSAFFKEANLVSLEKREEGESRTNFEIRCTIE